MRLSHSFLLFIWIPFLLLNNGIVARIIQDDLGHISSGFNRLKRQVGNSEIKTALPLNQNQNDASAPETTSVLPSNNDMLSSGGTETQSSQSKWIANVQDSVNVVSSSLNSSEPNTTSQSLSLAEITTLNSTSEPETSPEAASEPESTAEPKSTSEPSTEPESTPEATPEPTTEPESTPEATPEPTTEPESTPEPSTEPESTPETKPEPTTEPESTPEPSTEPESTPEATPEPVSTPEPSTEPEVTSEPTAEPSTEPEVTSEPTTEPEVNSEPTAEPEVTSEPTTEPEVTSEPTTEPEVTSEPPTEPEVTSEPTSEPETPSEPTSEPEVTPEPVTSSEPEVTPEPETSSEPEVTSEPETSSEPEVTPEPETSSEPEVTPEPETSSEPEITSEPETSSEPEVTSEPETSSEPEVTSEPETSSEPEVTPEPETSSEPEVTPEPETSAEPEVTSEPVTSSEPEVTPEPETSSEPEVTPEVESEPKVTSEPTTEPETEPGSGPEPESEFQSFPEPVPDWDDAMPKYKWGWDFFVYLYGILFLLLGIYSIFNIIRLWRIEHLLSKNYFVTLNALVTIMCILRALYLLIDAHNRKGTFHVIVNYFLFSTAFPCLTSAFSILFYALLLATRVRLLSTKIQKLSLLIGIITFHFTLSIIADLVVGFFFSARILLLVCQFFYVIWGTILFIGYFYIFNKLRVTALTRTRTMARGASFASNARNKSVKKKSRNHYTLSTSVKITFVAAIFGLICVLLEIYGIFGVYRLYIDGLIPDPWPFFAYQFLLRFVELCMCCLMVYVASQPIMHRRNSSDSKCSQFSSMLKRLLCTPQEDKEPIDLESNSIANSNAIVLSQASDEFNKKQTVIQFDRQKNDSKRKLKKERSHLVIKDGLVRFKAEDESVTGSEVEIGTSLPDLVHGAIIKGQCNSLSENNIDLIDEKFKEHNNVNKLHRCNTDNSYNLKRSIDLEKISIGTVGTFGTDLVRPLSSVNLTNSLEWEFEQAYERSFTCKSGSTLSLPNDLSENGVSGSKVKLLNNFSPPLNGNNSVFSCEESDSTLGNDSPSQKPLIRQSIGFSNSNSNLVTEL